jgi:hypothetical protein
MSLLPAVTRRGVLRELIVFLTIAFAAAGADQPPSGKDWKPLLNGRDLAGWHGYPGKPNAWIAAQNVRYDAQSDAKRLVAAGVSGPVIVNGPDGRTTNLVTDARFEDMELYLEFLIPKGSNSGVYLHGLYEVQVFDSYGSTEKLKTSDGGGVYHRWIDNHPVGGSPPRVNASRAPGEWQSYHIWFQGPRFDASGRKMANARFLRVEHNGKLVQENVALEGPTRAHMSIPEAASNPLMLQGDHGPVAFRNILWRPLTPSR